MILWNEPYLEKSGWEPSVAADALRNVMIPAADKLKLDLVSPTFHHDETQWMAEFLTQCWTKRNEKKNPCDVKKIKKFNMHAYLC